MDAAAKEFLRPGRGIDGQRGIGIAKEETYICFPPKIKRC